MHEEKCPAFRSRPHRRCQRHGRSGNTWLTRARRCRVKFIGQDRHTQIGSTREGVFSSLSSSLGIIVAIAVNIMVSAGMRFTRDRRCRVMLNRQDVRVHGSRLSVESCTALRGRCIRSLPLYKSSLRYTGYIPYYLKPR